MELLSARPMPLATTKEPSVPSSALECAAAQEETASVSMCCFRLCGARYGVDIRSVREILAPVKPWPVPLSPRFIGGLVRYRGDVLTTVDLRALLDPPQRTPFGQQIATPVLVVDGECGPYGLMVDSVEEVVAMDLSLFEPSVEARGVEAESLWAGVFRLAAGLLLQLDPLRLDPMRLAADQAREAAPRDGPMEQSGCSSRNTRSAPAPPQDMSASANATPQSVSGKGA